MYIKYDTRVLMDYLLLFREYFLLMLLVSSRVIKNPLRQESLKETMMYLFDCSHPIVSLKLKEHWRDCRDWQITRWMASNKVENVHYGLLKTAHKIHY